MGSRHPTPRDTRRGAHRLGVRTLGATAACLIMIGGALAITGVTGIGVAPAADTVLSCTDTWTGGAGTTDWGMAGNWRTGVPDANLVDACIPSGATVVDQSAAIVVGELTVAKGSSLTVGTGGTPRTGSAGASLSVTSGLDNDGTLTAEPSGSGTATLNVAGPVTNTGAFEVFGTLTIGNAAASSLTNTGTVAIAPGGVIDLENASTLTNAPNGLLALGISGPPTSASDYGEVLNGSLSLDGSVAPVFEGGFTPSSGVEYVVATSSFSGTFAHVRDGATADYSHPDALGLVGGAPASATAVGVTSTVPTSVFGQNVHLTATVRLASAPASGSLAPTGSVSFSAGGVLLGSTPVATAAGATTATLGTADLPVGSQTVTATYAGDVLFGPSTSSVDAQVVHPDNAHVTIAAAPTNAVPGQQVTYTVLVSAAAPGGGRAGGTVALSDDGNLVPGCQSLTLSSTDPPQVTCSETYDADATHSVVTTYNGSADFLPSTAALAETVAPRPTTTLVTASSRTSTTGEAVSFTATVTPSAGTTNPAGSVTFTDDGAPIGTSVLTTTAGVTTTSMLLTTLPLGVNSITASFGGDSDFGASTSGTALVTVSQAPTDVELGSSVNPSTSGQPLTFTARVFPATGSGETGTVTFSYNGTVIGSGNVSDGQASLTTATLPIGTGSVTATYGGDGNFAGGATTSGWSQEVDPPPG
ncbi:MAG TPA: Ig-like domain-containing protein [Acidimicrobiales bacterium]|nr:Ig-like domain-containing protein [Acidimicrobiales bacterium]